MVFCLDYFEIDVIKERIPCHKTKSINTSYLVRCTSSRVYMYRYTKLLIISSFKLFYRCIKYAFPYEIWAFDRMGKGQLLSWCRVMTNGLRVDFVFQQSADRCHKLLIFIMNLDLATPLSLYTNDFKNRSHWLWDIFISIFGSNARYLFALETFQIFKRTEKYWSFLSASDR